MNLQLRMFKAIELIRKFYKNESGRMVYDIWYANLIENN